MCTAAGAALVSLVAVVPSAGAATSVPAVQRFVAAGTATIGRQHYGSSLDPSADPNQFVTVDQVSLTGVFLFGIKRYIGGVHLATLHGSRFVDPNCQGDPEPTIDDVIFPCPSPPYTLTQRQVALSGQNGDGQSVTGWCQGGTFSGGTLDTRCRATLSGGPTRNFDLSVNTAGSQSGTKGWFTASATATVPVG